MISVFISSVVSFLSTNIDDMFVLMFLYLQANTRKDRLKILIGRYFGVASILVISFTGAWVLNFVLGEYLGLLGILPIMLGIKEWIQFLRRTPHSVYRDRLLRTERTENTFLSAFLLTISNSADNIGVYVPLVAGFALIDAFVFIAVFVIMTAMLCAISEKLISLPLVKEKLQRYKDILIPVIYIVLGVYIMAKNYL